MTELNSVLTAATYGRRRRYVTVDGVSENAALIINVKKSSIKNE